MVLGNLDWLTHQQRQKYVGFNADKITYAEARTIWKSPEEGATLERTQALW